MLLLLAAVGALVFMAVGRAQTLPRAAKVKRLVRAHTDARPGWRRRRSAGGRRCRLVFAALDQRLRGMRRFERIERLVETGRGARCRPRRSSSARSCSAILLVAILAAVVAGLASAFAIVVLLRARRGTAVRRSSESSRRGASARSRSSCRTCSSTIAGSLRVGHGLKASLQGIADEGAPPISTELRRVLSEARLGRPLEESLVAMCERLGSDDLLYVATAVEVQSQVGGSLAGLFRPSPTPCASASSTAARCAR